MSAEQLSDLAVTIGLIVGAAYFVWIAAAVAQIVCSCGED